MQFGSVRLYHLHVDPHSSHYNDGVNCSRASTAMHAAMVLIGSTKTETVSGKRSPGQLKVRTTAALPVSLHESQVSAAALGPAAVV